VGGSILASKLLKIDEKLHRELKIEAAKRGITLQELADSILGEWVDKNIKA
jgi:predicted HicB family RNase H-like nuclease